MLTQELNPNYVSLYAELMCAYNQAAEGKGVERHANDNSFEDQPILRLTEMVGLGYPIGQAMKKAQEAIRLLEIKGKQAAKNELYGAINYLAAACIHIDKTLQE